MPSPKRRILFIVLLSILAFHPALYCIAATDKAIPNIPDDSTKVLPLAPENSISTFVTSTSAPGNGLAVNIIYPKKVRYKDGAPLVVVIAGGDAPNGLNLTVHGAQVGFVEIRFSFPGGGVGNFKSGGYNDYRGAKSQKALRDILLFAAGKTEDFRHRTINDLLPIKLCTNNIGLVGWSNGGNVALVTMEKYAADLQFLRWLALYECPLGSLFFPPSLGSAHDFLPNSHYRQGSAATGHCLIDFRRLAWQADAVQNPGVHKKLGEPELPGVIYFDDNKNGRWDETIEFAFNYCLDKGLNKKIYPPDITAAMERLKIFNPPESNGSTNVVAANPNNSGVQNGSAQSTNAQNSSVQNSGAQNGNIQNAAIQNNGSPISAQSTTTSKNIVSPSSTKGMPPLPQKDTADKVIDAFRAVGKFKTKIERTNFLPSWKKDESRSTAKKPTKIAPKEISFWPPTIATLEESENYFQERDGSLSIPAICSAYPNLLITILASQVDHLQSQADHPHIVLQYNAWLDNNAHWVRLNPESIYLANLANMNKSNFVQNEPNTAIEATTINDYLEPAGALKDHVYADAAIAELADRCQFKNYNSPLLTPILIYNNGAITPAVDPEINDKK